MFPLQSSERLPFVPPMPFDSFESTVIASSTGQKNTLQMPDGLVPAAPLE